MTSPRYIALANKIATELGIREMSQLELSDLTGANRGAISQAVQILRNQNRMYISGYRQGLGISALYRLGNHPDAQRPTSGEKLLQERVRMVLHALHRTDLTPTQLVVETGIGRKVLHEVLTHMHAQKQIHIVAYKRQQHIYRRGAGVDARKTADEQPRPVTAIVIPPPDPLLAAFFGRAA